MEDICRKMKRKKWINKRLNGKIERVKEEIKKA